MALSQIDLCSKALIKVGANTITSFDEGTTEAQVAASLYPVARDALLSAHPWNFATAQSRLSPLTTPPLADFATAFLLPLDCVRVLSAGPAPQGRGLTYRIAGRQLHADADDVVLSYIRRPREDEFPPFFVAALIACLSAEFCIPLTDSTARWEALRRIADGDVRRARLIDAQEETTPQFSDFSLVEERY